jgi:predicted Zn-dependent protease
MNTRELDPSRALAIGEAVCARGRGVPLQATVLLQRNRLTRLGGGVVLHHAEIDDAKVIVRALLNGAEGVSFSNDLSEAGLDLACAQAIEIARLSPSLATRPPLPSAEAAGTIGSIDAWDEATALGNPEEEDRSLSGAIDSARAEGSVLAGILGRTASVRAVVNTEGLVRSSRSTCAYARFIATCGEGSGHGGSLVGSETALNLPALASKAARVAKAASDPISLPPGRYDVVLERAQSRGLTMRSAAYEVAVARVAEAIEVRGFLS